MSSVSQDIEGEANEAPVDNSKKNNHQKKSLIALAIVLVCAAITAVLWSVIGLESDTDLSIITETLQLTIKEGGFQYFGQTLDFSGDTLVVGAWQGTYFDDESLDPAYRYSSIYIYETNNDWSESIYVYKDYETAMCSEGFLINENSVAISNDVIVIGVILATEPHILVLEKNDTEWQETARLVLADGVTDNKFGYNVAISGDTVVATTFPRAFYLPRDFSWWDGGSTYNSISDNVYVFENDGKEWTQTAKLFDEEISHEASFSGFSIAIQDNTLAVGDSSTNTVYIYERGEEGEWNLEHTLVPDEKDAFKLHTFGSTIALSGDTLAVSFDDKEYHSVHVFERDNTRSWTKVAKLAKLVPSVYVGFELPIDISGNKIVVGAAFGPAQLFEKLEGEWTQTMKMVSSNDMLDFGAAVAIDGSTVVVGAPDVGSAYVYELLEEAV